MPRRYLLSTIILIILVTSVLAVLGSSMITIVSAGKLSGVKVIKGPSPIKNAESASEEDITLMNEYLAVTFGIGTSPPWGVPNGYIIDAAPVVNGVPGMDVLAQFSFIVNGWGKWAKLVDIEVVENTTSRGVIKAIGYWKDIKVEITYILEAGSKYLYIETKLTNEGTQPYKSLVSGYAISLKRGWTFTPGFGTGKHYAPTPKEKLGVIDDWVAGYYEDYALGLWAPYYTHLSTSTSWVDPLTIHTIAPGETKVFTAYLIFEPVGDTCKILENILQLKGIKYGTVKGTVTTVEGKLVETPIIIIEKDGRPYCWCVGSKGSYEAKLPPGTYTLHAEAKNYGPSSAAKVEIIPGAISTINFADVTSPGKVLINVYRADTGKPVDAKILISGGKVSIVRYLQVSTAYTDVENIGKAELNLAPGTYTLTVSYGGGFISKPVVLKDVKVESGTTLKYTVSIDILVKPKELGWYSADLHHHSNILDGRTPPDYLVVAQSAAALDFVFVSDHDSVVNHKEIAYWAEKRNMPFIPSVEISPNWGHFNPYPLPLGKDVLYRGTPSEIFKAAREAGAIVIRVNHPYRGGYFISWEKNELPGPYSPDWDVAEINGRWDRSDNKTLMKMWEFWNKGLKYYISAGSDTHDIWSSPYTGYPRVYAYIPAKPTPEAFAYAEKYGHSFITYGPLVFMEPLPGMTIPVKDEKSISLKLNLWAVDGLSRLIIVSMGKRVYKKTFPDKPINIKLEVEIPIEKLFADNVVSWISVMVWDADGDLAITNPVWISKEVVRPTITKTTTVTVTQTRVETKTLTQTQIQTVTTTTTSTATIRTTITKTTTETATQIKTITSTKVSITTTEVSITRWDITIAAAIIALIVGIAISYVLAKKKV